jgi:hypothetical protein
MLYKKNKITIYKILKDENIFNTFMYLINLNYTVSESIEFINYIINPSI